MRSVVWNRHSFALSFFLTLLVSWSCGGPGGDSSWASEPWAAGAPAEGTQGMVSTAHPLATQVGLDVLAAGGNAFDAAVAVAAALNVVEPMMSGMGGYGTILVYSAQEGRTRFLNASGRIPRGVDPAAFRAPTPGYLENRRGPKAISTPGNVNAWGTMAQEYGVLPWADLLEPAARLAEEGFQIDGRLAGAIDQAWDEFPEHARSVYGREGRPLAEGDRLVQADLARSLRQVGLEGPQVFHGGALGAVIDRAMQEAGSFLRLTDLAENEAEWWEPIEIDYRGHRVQVPSPPANSFPALVRLGMMSLLDVEEMGHNSVEYLHMYEEINKFVFWVRLKYAGDPDVLPPPLDTLLSVGYWQEALQAIDRNQALPFAPPRPPEPQAEIGAQVQGQSRAEGGGSLEAHTTHFVVADGDGNVVSATQTLGNPFGSRVMPEGTGIWLNNSLAYCTFLPPGNPMDAHPGRRKLSGDVPLFVLGEEGRPWLALGTPGGHTIPQTVPQMVMNVLDFGMNIQQAIAAPRISFAEPDLLLVENAVPWSVGEALNERGHVVMRQRALGNAHGLMIEWNDAGRPVRFTGGADPRGAGLARGR